MLDIGTMPGHTWYVFNTKRVNLMDKSAVSQRLKALAADDKKRSKAARLRDVIEDVEAALAAGVPRQDVLDELNSLGLDMNLATFETTLKRIRAKQKVNPFPTSGPNASQITRTPSFQQKPTARPQKAKQETHTEDPPDQEQSHDPKDLDSIMGSVPDLDTLAKLAKKGRKK